MKYPKVGIGIACRDNPHPKVVDAIEAMDYPELSVLVMNLDRPALPKHSQHICDGMTNANIGRNAIRDHVIKNTDWDYLLMMDDDVAPPPNAIREMLWMKAEICGAWIPAQPDNKRWASGKISPDGKWFQPFTRARVVKGRMDEPGVAAGIDGPYKMDINTGSLVWDPITSDIAVMGCSLISRALLELVQFRWNPGHMAMCAVRRHPVCYGESGALGQDIKALGEKIVMSHKIICQHFAWEKKK